MFLTLLVLISAAWSETKTDAIKLVDDAAKQMASQPREAVVAELSKAEGKWVKGELYVFAYDLQGIMVAHPKNAKLIGKNLLEVPDVDGKLFRKEIVELAKTKGSGWVDYKYKNPESGKTEAKTTYLKKVGDLILCCGIYKD
ncbi:MAG: cache domain-containing protein [Fibrobacterota bacterium]|nr:cache domain-containing protein [Fibrobacterota bacterium]QQS07666.1 MAG: cache domain-containing protein [Fibrobacterota bacterium]